MSKLNSAEIIYYNHEISTRNLSKPCKIIIPNIKIKILQEYKMLIYLSIQQNTKKFINSIKLKITKLGGVLKQNSTQKIKSSIFIVFVYYNFCIFILHV